MEALAKYGKLEQIEVEAIVLGIFEGEKQFSKTAKTIDTLLGGRISNLIQKGNFKGGLGNVGIIYPAIGIKAEKVILAGLGKKANFNSEIARRASGYVARFAKKNKIDSLSFSIFGEEETNVDAGELAQAMVEGGILANYSLDDYRTEGKENLFQVKKFTIIEENKNRLKKVEAGVKWGNLAAWSTTFSRDLINHPSNVVTPTKLSQVAQEQAKKFGFDCKVLTLPEIKKLKMGAFLGVAQGSQEPAKFIILEYNAGKKNLPTIALVGKGITFDSGGISIKPSEKMEQMKGDMAGAALTIATVSAVAQAKLPVHLVGLVPTTENLPSGTALKPGDILASYSGKTIEIISTDAEGRLILADALAYALNYNPKAIIDVATLTGGMIISLGDVCAGLFGNDDKLRAKMKVAGMKSGERVWELPMYEEYGILIKSDLADVKNSGGRPGQSITAAKFLEKFVSGKPWIHLDIAGVDFEERGEGPWSYVPKGATGFGARLLLQFLREYRR
jgi:leucyl aminopeptidase